MRRAERAARARTTRSTSADPAPSSGGSEGEQLGRRAGANHSRTYAAACAGGVPSQANPSAPLVRCVRSRAQCVGVVCVRLDPHEQAVERSDVHANRVVTRLEGLDERRPGAGERIEDTATGLDVAPEQLLDELWDELAEVRVETVDVLRALALGQLRLGPGQREVEPAVQGLLRGRHWFSFGAWRHDPSRPLEA